jgi:hypothetical protein
MRPVLFVVAPWADPTFGSRDQYAQTGVAAFRCISNVCGVVPVVATTPKGMHRIIFLIVIEHIYLFLTSGSLDYLAAP